MMRGASVVVLVLGHGAGTLWELGEAMRTLAPQRLLLLVTMSRREYDRCREVVEAGLRQRAETVRRETGARWTPPPLPGYVLGALDRSMWPAVVQLTDYELRTGKRHG